MRHDSQVASGGFPSIRIAAEPGKDRSAHRDVLPSPSTRLALLEMTKVAHVYAQNQKTLRDYYAALP
jgi:hypothetical protein